MYISQTIEHIEPLKNILHSQLGAGCRGPEPQEVQLRDVVNGLSRSACPPYSRISPGGNLSVEEVGKEEEQFPD